MILSKPTLNQTHIVKLFREEVTQINHKGLQDLLLKAHQENRLFARLPYDAQGHPHSTKGISKTPPIVWMWSCNLFPKFLITQSQDL